MRIIVFLITYLASLAANAGPAFYFENYQKDDTSVFMVFSAHTTISQDNELKRLWRILDGEVSERQVSHLEKQIKAKIEKESAALKLERSLLERIKKQHASKAFQGVLGEFSEQDRDRYLLRIEVASFVRERLNELVDLPQQEIDDFLLLLTGEDVFPLLKGNTLAGLPLMATENAELKREVGGRIARCKGIMATLGLASTSEEAIYVSQLLEPFYLPHPELYADYLLVRQEIIERFQANALLRLRVRIKENEVEQAISNCDALFDKRRDNLVMKIIHELPAGQFLLTRGIAHRFLLDL